MVLAGWTCLGVAVVLAVLVVTLPLAGPFLLAAVVLSIIAMANGRGRAGLTLLLCSLLAPMVLASLIVIGIFGALATAVTSVVQPPSGNQPTIKPPIQVASVMPPIKPQAVAPATPPVQRPVPPPVRPPVPPPVQLQPLAVSAFLMEMNKCGKAHKAALTSAQKQVVWSDAQARATEMSKDKEMTLRGVVRDVSISHEGAAEISYSGIDLGSFASVPSPTIRVRPSGRIVLRMSREKALAIVPGQPIELQGRTTFRPGSSALFDVEVPSALEGAGVQSPKAFVAVTFISEANQLGSIQLSDVQCRIGRADPHSTK
jgi:hypothetical protein